jgi:hypothetical protein
LIQTPFGPKRDRWLTTDLEKGLGIESSLLSNEPKQGTLLSNLTCLMAHIAFRAQPRRLRQFDLAAAPRLLKYPYDKLRVSRIVEQGSLANGKEFSLFTDLADYPHRPADPRAPATLLVYSVQESERASPRLITAFPVTATAVKELTAELGDQAPIRLRFNAYLKDLHGQTVLGRRKLVTVE